MGESLKRGMVLVLSLWDDAATKMKWLDGATPSADGTRTAADPGVKRGPCAMSAGDPAQLRGQYPNAHAIYTNIKVGEIGSTYTKEAQDLKPNTPVYTTSRGNRNHVDDSECAADSKNCLHTGCCQNPGHKCYMKDAYTAFCRSDRPPASWWGHVIQRNNNQQNSNSRVPTTTVAAHDDGTCSAAYGQCGGKNWNGPTCCESGCHCRSEGEWYSQCAPPAGSHRCGGSTDGAIIFAEQVQAGPLAGGVTSAGSLNMVMAGFALTFVIGASISAVMLRGRQRRNPDGRGDPHLLSSQPWPAGDEDI